MLNGRPEAGEDPGFFLGGGALVSCCTSTPINHSFFFLQNSSCIRKPQVISGGGGAHPLHPPLRSAPGKVVLSTLPDKYLGDSRFWTVSPSLCIRV